MRPRLLIINAASPYFFYIPMGAFGVCDFLEQHQIASQLFNPALYPQPQVAERLLERLSAFQPSHVALLFHWQETVHGMEQALEIVRGWSRETVTLVGGFSASHFGHELLLARPDIDYLIHGDPEQPLLQLLQGAEPATIANLSYRQGPAICRSSGQWLIDRDTLDSISFARLDLLHDWPLYLEKINSKLGFPLFIGRGCVFNCRYCGGSRQAFRNHSSRHQPVQRSLGAIIADLQRLKEYTDSIYICYENDLDFIVRLFERIAAEDGLRHHFCLNYGAWHLLDESFMAAYGGAFKYSASSRPVIEFSPEVIDDSNRSLIKGHATYGLEPLIANCRQIARQLDQEVRIELFFSRYHPTEKSYPELQQEIRGIYRLKHRLFREGEQSIRICYDHLSTDVGSLYWQEQLPHPFGYATFLEQKTAIDNQTLYPFPVDNLCFYIPEGISAQQRLCTEALLQSLELIESRHHELFQLLFFSTDCHWLTVLEQVINDQLGGTSNEAFEAHSPEQAGSRQAAFFNPIPLSSLLEDAVQRLLKDPASAGLTFLPDLLSFSLAKERLQAQPSPPPGREPAGSARYQLAPQRYRLHQHDYLDIQGLFQRLNREGGCLKGYQRTVFLFLDRQIMALPHASYRATLRFFERGGSVHDYLESLGQEAPPEALRRQQQLVERLIFAQVLVPLSAAQEEG
ncbi:hypothetical protein [Desulfogranum mediterraneum]|uniref:hypothetical protein n=1 Tax=Desulfogranum mediterraneum TaxID=160661 RepID=UPI00041D1695|nr:hypothetical protein [Desulfogranum mediterraneum]